MSLRPRASAPTRAPAGGKKRLDYVLAAGLRHPEPTEPTEPTQPTEALGLVPVLAAQGVIIPWAIAYMAQTPLPAPNDPGLENEAGDPVIYQPYGVNLRPGQGIKADLLWDPKRWWNPSTAKDKPRLLTTEQEKFGFKPISSGWTPASLEKSSKFPGATPDGNGNWEFQLYTKENVEVDSAKNKITLKANLIPASDPAGVRDSARNLIDWAPHPDHDRLWQFTSGKAVNDNGGGGFGMGTMTFTVTNPNRLPMGCWPSVWLLGRGNWPTGGEIDILEMLPLEAGRRKISSATHFGHHPTERGFDKGEVGAYNFGEKIEMKVTRTKTRITVHARDADKSRWKMINDVDLTNFGNKGDVSQFMDGPMDLIANIAVGGSGLAMDLPASLGRVSADPRYFKWLWKDAKWEIEKFGWIEESEYKDIKFPERETQDPALGPGIDWAKFEDGMAAWQRNRGWTPPMLG